MRRRTRVCNIRVRTHHGKSVACSLRRGRRFFLLSFGFLQLLREMSRSSFTVDDPDARRRVFNAVHTLASRSDTAKPEQSRSLNLHHPIRNLDLESCASRRYEMKIPLRGILYSHQTSGIILCFSDVDAVLICNRSRLKVECHFSKNLFRCQYILILHFFDSVLFCSAFLCCTAER